jgi:asparagine synthase (glutamine-hydrolysing)
MCGIAVILPGSAIDAPTFAIDQMTAALSHRGPDMRASICLPGCYLGHTRLSILDLENGTQPMSDPSGRFWIVFNGEIYNHRQIRAELERRRVAFRTRSDTEVLLAACIHFGPAAALRKLNGQFAFAIWDTVERRLFAARDRFGEKPLYWTRSPAGHVLIASEIKAILAAGLVTPRLDRASVDAYLGLFYVPPDRSIYENVHPLPPAHQAVWENGVPEVRRYWTPRYDCHTVDEIEAVKHVRVLLGRVVERQMTADVPVGAFLSGGLDSSTIVALMSRHARGPVRTFSAGFGDLIDELPFAREVASAYGTDHHETQVEIDVPEMLERMGRVYDEPFADSSNIPTWLLARHARKHVKVVLSGDGGDEIFGGYDWYTPLLRQSPRGQWWEQHVGSATGLLFDRRSLWGVGRQPPSREIVRQRYRPGPDVAELDQATDFDLTCYLPGDILVKVDRAAMAHGLETRAPLLDAELADFVLGLPWRMRFRDGTLKHLLRAACADLWPASIGARPKQGFGAPVRHWLQKPAVQAMWEHVIRTNGPLMELLPGVRNVAAELRPQRKWTLLCLGHWLERRSECLARAA